MSERVFSPDGSEVNSAERVPSFLFTTLSLMQGEDLSIDRKDASGQFDKSAPWNSSPTSARTVCDQTSTNGR